MIYKGNIFKNRIFDFEKLVKYGFVKKNGEYIFNKSFSNGDFILYVKILKDKIDTKLIEASSNEEYTLIYIQNATGKFVGQVREDYEAILTDIAQNCTSYNIFKSKYTKKIIEYIKAKYFADPEYLWDKTPNNAIFRESKTAKWYAVILTIQKNKLGLNGEEEIEIIDLKANPEIIEQIVDNKKYFHGYHMNKKHWLTIRLDGSVDIKEIYKFIDSAYKSVAHNK